MNGTEFQEKRNRKTGAASTMYEEKFTQNHPPLKKSPRVYLELSPIARDTKYPRSDSGLLNGSRSNGQSPKGHAESELMQAKAAVKTQKIEQSNLRAKAQMAYTEKLRTRGTKADGNTDTHQYLQVITEIKDVKQAMKKLKDEMASLLAEKGLAAKEIEASNSRLQTLSSSMGSLKEEIEETNEEQVLVELGRIEALKEYEAIESQRKKDADKYSAAISETMKKMKKMKQEAEAAKDLEKKLAITTSDVNMLEGELKQVKEMNELVRGTGSGFNSQDGAAANTTKLLKAITKEIEETKKELASVREEGFKFMASMDIIRTELKNVSEEAARSKKRELKTELTVQNLNAKLLRGKAKLEAATTAEEKAKDILSNLTRALEQLTTEAEAAKKEKLLIEEESETIIAEIEKTESDIDLGNERLEAAIEELKAVKSAEAKALEQLKTLIDNAVRRRVSVSQRSSVITISSFECEYLRDRAVGAEEIADKKVAAAHAWVEAIKASEREILMKTEMAKKEMEDLKLKEDQGATQTRQSFHAKRRIEIQVEKWRQKYEEIMDPDEPRTSSGLPGRSTNRSGRRAKMRRPASPATPHTTPRSTAFAVGGRRKVMPNLAKLFRSKNANKSIAR